VAAGVRGDRSFARVAAVPTSRGTIVVYRTNGGALTSFGIVVRQQYTVFPGVLVVHNLADNILAMKPTWKPWIQ
jgi:hypothetical protein